MADKADEQPSANSGSSEGVLEKMEAAVPRGSPAESDEKVAEKQPEQKPQDKKPSKLKQIWQKLGLDPMTLILMFKGSLPPAIAIAMYQSKTIQAKYSTVGYLIAISSILGFCILPRGKFIQTMTLNVIAICFASCINLLALFCVTKAREHTTPPGTPPTVILYNPTASTVAAIWLIVQTYIINVLRAKRPQFLFPAILWSIFVAVSLTYGVLFPNMSTAITFIERLLETFLTGFALATAVGLLIFPISSRKVVFKEMTGYLMLLGGCLKAQTAFMASIEGVDPVQLKEQHEKAMEDGKQSHHWKHKKPPTILETPALAQLRALQNKLLDLHGKLNGDVTPAKREFAIGKLESHDLTLLWRHMQQIFLPIMGLMSMINVLERQAELSGWASKDGTEEELEERHHQLDNVHFLLKELHGPFGSMVSAIDGAFNHILLTLELINPPKTKQPDIESTGEESAKPGTPKFTEAYRTKVQDFYTSKEQTLRDWCAEHNIELPPDFFESSFVRPERLGLGDERTRERNQRQLFFTLYLEYLLWRTSASVLDLVVYVDKRKQEGAFEKTKLIFPGSLTLYKWVKATVGRDDISEEDTYSRNINSGGDREHSVNLGKNLGRIKDPEHLPPRNTAEKIGQALGRIPHFFRSEESMFAFRVVAATMTIGIICYLSASQAWFIEQRLLWAMIMVAISMTPTAGQSLFGFFLRIFGTLLATIGAYIIWYIVDGKIPGVIVFLWLWIFVAYYFVLKYPKLAMAAVIALVTAVLIIGYELQVRTLGLEIATANGQPAYPTYELAPYRLATVVGGLFVGFIWTIFPYPVSESSKLRRDISDSLYLMSSFYSAVHETVNIRVRNTGGDPNTKGTHAYNLDKARTSLFSKQIMLLTSLRTDSSFSKFQIQVGGRFPQEDYEELIECLRRMTLWTSLASYCSQTFQTSGSSAAEMTTWSNDFRQLLSTVNVTSHKITSLLSLLSSSLSNAQPLPPHLDMPEPFQFVKRLEALDRDILSIRHIAEPEYSAFAVMQIVSQGITRDMTQLTNIVKGLVGEIDFSYQALNPGLSSSDASSTDLTDGKGKVE